MKKKSLCAAVLLVLCIVLMSKSSAGSNLPDPGSAIQDAINAVEDYAGIWNSNLLTEDPHKILPEIPVSAPDTKAPTPETQAPANQPSTLTPDNSKVRAPNTKRTRNAVNGRMTSEGPMFVSFRNNLTDEPYMFTPLDLSTDGDYRFPLIGDFARVVGEVQVLVRSGMTNVTCHLNEGVTMDEKKAFYTFFTDIRAVKTIEPSKLRDVKLTFAFPYAVPILLQTDTKVLLYVNCPITYQQDQSALTSFSPQNPDYLDRMMALLPLMD